MSGEVFFDTNMLIYVYSIDEPEKRQQASATIEMNQNRWISTQVLSELCNTLSKKFRLDYRDIGSVLDEIQASFQVVTVKPPTIERAIKLAQTYHYSYYDSLIIAAALEQSCRILYSEDMQHGQVIEQQLTILNPFQARG